MQTGQVKTRYGRISRPPERYTPKLEPHESLIDDFASDEYDDDYIERKFHSKHGGGGVGNTYYDSDTDSTVTSIETEDSVTDRIKLLSISDDYEHDGSSDTDDDLLYNLMTDPDDPDYHPT